MRKSISLTAASSLQNNKLFILKERAFVTPLKWKTPLIMITLKQTVDKAENLLPLSKLWWEQCNTGKKKRYYIHLLQAACLWKNKNKTKQKFSFRNKHIFVKSVIENNIVSWESVLANSLGGCIRSTSPGFVLQSPDTCRNRAAPPRTADVPSLQKREKSRCCVPSVLSDIW